MGLTQEEEQILYWGAVLHDIGKTVTTVWQDNRWRSPGHERAGVPIARDLLLAQPDISAEARLRILDLVRWHGLPLKWSQHQDGLASLKLLGTRTDLRLLSIFSLFDFHGRENVEHDQTLEAMEDFKTLHAPQAEFELGRFADLQKVFAGWNRKQRNAAWNALRMGRADLLEKLVSAAAPEDDHSIHRRKVVVTIGLPKCGKSTWLDQHYPDAIRVQLADHHLETEKAPESFNMDRRLVEFKVHLENYLRNNKVLVIEGNNQVEIIRQRVNDLLRDQIAHIHYVVFENSLEQLLQRNDPASHEMLRTLHATQDLIHPWEAHTLEWVSNS
jgi:predicted kinase